MKLARWTIASLLFGLAFMGPMGPITVKGHRQQTAQGNRFLSHQTRTEQAKSLTENLNGVSLEMVLIPAGTFTMGSTKKDYNDHEKPAHQVTVPAFYIGKYEITQAQWKAVMGEAQLPGSDERTPVNDVRWGVAKQFCQELSRMTKKAYRLPSEAEWEYACRAGTTGDFAGDVNKMAWYEKDPRNWDKSKSRFEHPVGQLLPNAFGLYDMHGNVTEWCEDWWHESYDDAPTDGSAWTEGGDSRFRVGRGGSWGNHKGMVTSAFRYIHPLNHFTGYGLRVVVSAK